MRLQRSPPLVQWHRVISSLPMQEFAKEAPTCHTLKNLESAVHWHQFQFSEELFHQLGVSAVARKDLFRMILYVRPLFLSMQVMSQLLRPSRLRHPRWNLGKVTLLMDESRRYLGRFWQHSAMRGTPRTGTSFVQVTEQVQLSATTSRAVVSSTLTPLSASLTLESTRGRSPEVPVVMVDCRSCS